MRYLILTLFATLMMTGTVSAGSLNGSNNNTSLSSPGDTVKVAVAPELKVLVNEWISEFSKTQPLVNFSVKEINEAGASVNGALWFLTDKSSEEKASALAWQLTIGHNSVVPVVSSRNKLLSEIAAKGLTPDEFGSILTSGMKWSELFDDADGSTVEVFVKNDQNINSLVEGFSGKDPVNMKIKYVNSGEEFIKAVAGNDNVIGFCRLSDVKNDGMNELVTGLALLPIDKNMNGRIDNFEKIYGSPDELSRGLWIGKYPRALSGSIYLMTDKKPQGQANIAFLSWIMNEGSGLLAENGFTGLVNTEKESVLASLTPSVTVAASAEPAPNIWITLLLCTAVIGILAAAATGLFGRKKAVTTEIPSRAGSGINPRTMLAPGGLFYDRSHTWAFMEKDGLIRMGVDDFMQHLTGDITRIILKEHGTFVRRGEQILTLVRDGKQLNLYSPVSGVIRSQNTDLYLDSTVINSSPYSDGWVYLIEPRNWAREIQLMFMSEKYAGWIDEEFTRLKNFFAETLIPNTNLPGYVIMQDGGELRENPLADLDPEVWEEFQTRFIDVSK